MGCAPMAFLLWSQVMKYNPSNPQWVRGIPRKPGLLTMFDCGVLLCLAQMNRDRFVLSNGHACALQYTMLHLAGYDVTLDDLKSFRQMGSKCVAVVFVPILALFCLLRVNAPCSFVEFEVFININSIVS